MFTGVKSAICLCVLTLLPLAPRASAAASGSPVSFNNQIEPILSEYCFKCHGPDSASRKPKKNPMRLDRDTFAFEPRDDGKPVIIKGDPKSSELIRRINAQDDDIMPPASEQKTMKPEEKALLAQWISEGAKYEKHWSLIPPVHPAPPADPTGWAKNPVDQFVAAKMKQAGLKPNPEENPARLFRRLSFDLTGLPPSPAELDEFLNNKSPKAYETAVDRMLASDACAEQFTRVWLDAVRYADTQGIHHDHSRSIWPYRDWVIAAFKANMRFDQFTIEQIAGDLLPDATMDQKIASGYNRLLPTTGEGGAIPEEYAAIYAKDRAETTSAVWLGLTTGCATCHDHKFDPITMKDFYSMTAFFRNSTVPSLDAPDSGNTKPVLFVPAKADRPRWTELEAEIAANSKSRDARAQEARPDFEKWLSLSATATEPASASAPILHLPLSEIEGPFKGTFDKSVIDWRAEAERHAGPFGPAPLIHGGSVLENASPSFARDGQASYGGFLFLEGKPSGAVVSRMDKAAAYRGWDLLLSEGRPSVHVIDHWPDKALKITAKAALQPGRWHHVLAVFDGARKGADALALFVDGVKAEVEINNNDLGPDLTVNAPFRLGSRSDGSGTSDALANGKVFLQDFRFYNKALDAHEIFSLATAGFARELVAAKPDARTNEQTNRLLNLYLTEFDALAKRLGAELSQLKAEQERLRERGAITLVMEEKKDSAPTAHILLRGNYASKGDEVSAATPAALPPPAPDLPHNSLGLARWILSHDNPLTARVTVNRIWAQLFGLGIVETTEDLGVKGARPTDQPLLDWLAVEFMDSGWDMRHIVKLMAMSETYKQSDAVSADKLAKDPLNRLYSRGPHIRLDAEQIRDQALAASGLLVRTVGGPPVKPYQPDGLWETVAMKDSNTRVYAQDHGEALYRRSMYTFWKRISPPPTLEILNAPTREVFCTRRDRTDTPLQALVTMNDPQFIEAARRLAANAIEASPKDNSRLDDITQSLLGRRFYGPEREVALKLQQKALKRYHENSADAEALIHVGESTPDAKIQPAELAAWTVVASDIMNLDECLTK